MSNDVCPRCGSTDLGDEGPGITCTECGFFIREHHGLVHLESKGDCDECGWEDTHAHWCSKATEKNNPLNGSDDDYDEPASCGVCGGALMVLGTLGTRVHSRCQSCGLDSNTTQVEAV